MKLLNWALSVIKEPMTLRKYRKYSLCFLLVFIVLLLFKNYVAPMFMKETDVLYYDLNPLTMQGAYVFDIERTNIVLFINQLFILLATIAYVFISIKRILNIKSDYPENFRRGFLSYAVAALFCIILTIIDELYGFSFNTSFFLVSRIFLILVPLLLTFTIQELLSEKESESKKFWWGIFSKIDFFRKIIIAIKNSSTFHFIKKNVFYMGLIFFIFFLITTPLWWSSGNSVVMWMIIPVYYCVLLSVLCGTVNLVRMLFFVGK